MKGNLKMDAQHSKCFSKSSTVEKISLVVSIFSICVSIWSLFSSQQTSKELVKYQVSQERLPVVTGLNHEIPVQLKRASNSLGNVMISDSNSDKIYPLQIALYNIGPGIAQNCKAEWESSSIQDAGAQMIDLLKNNSPLTIEEFSFKQIQTSWYPYDYLVNIESENNIEKILYWDGSTYAEEDFSLQTVRSSYLQPLFADDCPLTISLPQGFSLLLLEMVRQEIPSPVSAKLYISYQDVVGEEFTKTYDVTFFPLIESKTNDYVNGYIYVSFEATDAS